MIAKIRKHTFLVYHMDYDDLLHKLRATGVVHIDEKIKFNECKTIEKDLMLLKRYKKAIRQLSAIVSDATPSELPDDPLKVLVNLESLFNETEEIGRRLELLRPEADRAKPWGEFNLNTLKKLKESSWSLSLFVCPEKRFQEKWEEDFVLEIISRDRGKLYFAVIHREDEAPDIEADQEKIPEKTAGSVIEEISLCEKKIEEIESTIKDNTPVWLASLNRGTDDAISRIEYSGTAEQADKYAEDNLYVLEGWVPLSEEKEIDKVLQETDCYSYVSEPDANEKIPVILKNNRFATLFEPISKLFALPDYRELDLTPFFAPFFMLFFGFCLGDAGYGLFFIVAGFFIKKRVKPEYRPVISLAQYFGVAAILFGLISGTFFGINLIDSGYTITENSVVQMKKEGVPARIIYQFSQIKGETFKTKQSFTSEAVKILGEDGFSEYRRTILKSAESNLPFLNYLRHYMLDPINMFYLAIIIGGFQIIFGMILKIINTIRLRGFKYSIPTIGWVMLAFTIVIFKGGGAVNLINETQLKPLFIGLIVVSGVLIFLFNSPDLNIFLRVGKGVWDSYNIITGVFGDLLSYIRLFALGISSSILGFVFNQISSQMLSVPYVGWLLFLLLLVVGHTMNIAIATLGSFVHPMRLTFVEFYKNAGFTGGGIKYKPFKIKK